MNTVIDIQRLLPAWKTLQEVAPVSRIESESDYDQMTTLLIVLCYKTCHRSQHLQATKEVGHGWSSISP